MELEVGLTAGSRCKHQCRATSQIQGLYFEVAIGAGELCKQRSRDDVDYGEAGFHCHSFIAGKLAHVISLVASEFGGSSPSNHCSSGWPSRIAPKDNRLRSIVPTTLAFLHIIYIFLAMPLRFLV